MKTKNFTKAIIFIFSLFSSEILFSQGLFWRLGGNTNVVAASFVGPSPTNAFPLQLKTTNTTTPQPINFFTANIQRATILGNGNFGIGTLAPNNLIQVQNLINFDNANISTSLGFQAGNSNAGNRSTFVGFQTGFSNTTGFQNTGIGAEALFSNMGGNQNNALGMRALYNNLSANRNTAVGGWSLFSNTGGGENTATGFMSLYFNNGIQNTANGAQALFNNISGSANTAVGHNALFSNQTITGLTAVGYASLFSNNTGTANAAVGGWALQQNTSGSRNTAMGSTALNANNNGYENTACGETALTTNIGGFSNTSLGTSSMFWNNSGNQNTALGVLSLALNTAGNFNTAGGYGALYNSLTANYNTAYGYISMVFNGTGQFNSAFGAQTLWQNGSGFENAANGMSALFSNGSGFRNTASGYASLYNNASGNNNTATGNRALFSNSVGSSNTANGFSALYFNNAFNNTAVGFQALYNNNQSNNTAVGWNALFSNNSGGPNVGIGVQALFSNISGSSNTAVGWTSLFANVSGSANTAVGNGAGAGFDGSNNTFIGSGADASASGLSNSAAIGSGAIVTANDKMILGNNSVNVGIGLSGVAGGPQNKLEINTANAFNTPNTCGGQGFSGLRFRDLTSGSTPCTSNNLALSVNANGDVILVPGGGGAIASCGSATPLTTSSEINLGTNNFVFRGAGNVGIGTFCSPTAKLEVVQSNPATSSTAGYFSIGGTGTLPTYWGVAVQNAVNGSSNPGQQNQCIRGDASGGTQNYGILGFASGGAFNFGGYFNASGGGSYAVYGDAGSPTTNYAGFFNGNVFATGTITSSDSVLKENIDTISDALQIISQLIPRKFNYQTSTYPYFNLPQGLHYGLISQEVETVLPELISNNTLPEKRDSVGNLIAPQLPFKGLSYGELIPILIKGMQQQQAQIASLQNNARVNNNNTQGEITSEKIKLTLPDAPLLSDPRPNPNSGYAEITYYLPENIGNGKIIFIDMLGRTMEEKIITAGYGVIGIDTYDLPSGTYTYSMIVNEKILTTKQMIRTK